MVKLPEKGNFQNESLFMTHYKLRSSNEHSPTRREDRLPPPPQASVYADIKNMNYDDFREKNNANPVSSYSYI